MCNIIFLSCTVTLPPACSHSCSYLLLLLSVNLWRLHIIIVKNATAVPIQKPHTQTHTITYTGTHTRTYRPLDLKEWLFFSANWVLTLSSKLLPGESWVRQTSNVNLEELKSLIFLSDTFSPLAPKKHCLSPSSSDCVIVPNCFGAHTSLLLCLRSQVLQTQSLSQSRHKHVSITLRHRRLRLLRDLGDLCLTPPRRYLFKGA